MLKLDESLTAKPANTNFPASRGPRLLKSGRAAVHQHHYNLSTARRNQYLNANLRDLKRPTMSLEPRTFKEPSPERQRKSPSSPNRCKCDVTDSLKWPAAEDPLLGNIECPLNSPDFPPVSEKDHFVGRCYCHLCTCAEHVCLKVVQRRSYQSRRFTTCSQDSPPLMHKQTDASLPSTQLIDFLTTKQRDFLTFTVTANLPKPMTAPISSFEGRPARKQLDSLSWEPNEKSALHRLKPASLRQRTKLQEQKKPVQSYFDKLNKTIFSLSVNNEHGVGAEECRGTVRPPGLRPMTVSVRRRKGDWSPPAPKPPTQKLFLSQAQRSSIG